MKKKIILSILIITLLLSTVLINFAKAETKPFEKFTGLYIKTSEAKPGDKIYVDLYAMFEGDADVTVVLKNLNRPDRTYEESVNGIKLSNPYFMLNSDVKSGERIELTSIKVSTDSGIITYSTIPGDQNYTNCLGKKYITVLENEEELSLKNISIKGNTTFNADVDKIYFNLETSQNVEYMSICLRDKTNTVKSLSVYISDIYGNSYINLKKASDQISSGSYYISDVFLFGKNNNSLQYSNYSTGSGILPLNFNVSFTIENINSNASQSITNKDISVIETAKLNSLKINSTTAKKNEKVEVDLSVDKSLSQCMLSFIDKNSENSMIVYLKGLETKAPYFIVPYTTELGTYELNYAILKERDGNKTHYRKGVETEGIMHFDFDSFITIEESDTLNSNLLYIDNKDLTMDIINDIYKVDENITIEVNAYDNPIIDKALFEAIKGKDKTIILQYNDIEWIFNGKDIKDSKTINISTNIYKSSNEEDNKINSMLVDTGIILEFAENGILPGKCLIRVQATEDIVNTLNKEYTKIYYYNSDEDIFNKVKMQTILTEDNYYEFYINHNSKYVLTKNEINSIYVSTITTDLELNGETMEILENTEAKEPPSLISNLLKNKILLKQLGVILVCIIILILIGKGVILSNKESKIKKED